MLSSVPLSPSLHLFLFLSLSISFSLSLPHAPASVQSACKFPAICGGVDPSRGSSQHANNDTRRDVANYMLVRSGFTYSTSRVRQKTKLMATHELSGNQAHSLAKVLRLSGFCILWHLENRTGQPDSQFIIPQAAQLEATPMCARPYNTNTILGCPVT